ncbi:putative glycoside hydrolase [Actinophytocola glycyrrhizae]|uniref:Glycoside hydrolase n=1 Tax=Actinophytocola glycyrrhizae TaxID=2044873 RepID=A0ABV9S592_9PSEU
MVDRRRRGRIVALVCVGVLAALAVLAVPGVRHLTGGPAIKGVADGAVITPGGLAELSITAPAGEDLSGVDVLVNGQPAKVRRAGDRMVLADTDLDDGTHTVTARRAHWLLPDNKVTHTVTVDSTPPRLTVDETPVTDLRAPFTLRGRAEGATAVTVDHRPADLGDDGAFTISLPTAPATLQVVARDEAGNNTTREHTVPARHPGMRAVHMTAMGWTSATLREPVLAMAAEGRIDTIQLDIKDENGEIGYSSKVPLAQQIGATRDHYDAKAVVDELHAAGIRVVGRLVAFRDPILAQASWRSGHKDRVLQTAAGQPWSGSYGEYAFTNFANPDVIAYNIALAEEAAKLGFDDILYDYVRRPEGALSAMRIPGLRGTPEQAIATFLGDSRDAVRPHGTFVGASVFGIAAQHPTAVAQDIRAIAEHVDYVSPMVYPSHWGPGEYGVAHPEAQPYDIVARSVAAFTEQVRGTGAQVIPWLQAFSLAHAYGPDEVLAQVTASAKAGASSFLLWDPACRYNPAAPPPR